MHTDKSNPFVVQDVIRGVGPVDDWREVAQAAATLMATGEYTTVAYAVRTARELVREAQKPATGEGA